MKGILGISGIGLFSLNSQSFRKFRLSFKGANTQLIGNIWLDEKKNKSKRA